jgi:Ca-activated chloride channel family protein
MTSNRPAVFTLCAVAVAAVWFAPAVSAGKLEVEAELGQPVIEAKRGQTIYLRLNLKALAAERAEARRAPVNVALVLDKSGSMQGDRIAAAREAARLALERLSAEDWVSVVTFNHAVDVVLPSQHLRDQSDVRRRIDSIMAGGTTAIHAGVSEGGRQVSEHFDGKRVNRVILMSDGQANVGPSSPKELAELGRRLASKGITVTTIGLGLDYNEDLMARLASASDGNHAFAKTPADLVRFFNLEFGDALSITAQEIEIEIDIETGFKPKRVLSREADISGQTVKVKLNSMQLDNERYVVVELETDGQLPVGPRRVGQAKVGYIDIDTGAKTEVRATIDGRITDQPQEAAASLNKTVSAQVATQIAVEETRRAIDLRDKGDVTGAKGVLDNASRLVGAARVATEAAAPGSPGATRKALSDLEKLESKTKEASDNLEGGKWEAQRKSLKHDQNTFGAQQKY